MPNLVEFTLLAKHAPYQLYRYAMDWYKQNTQGQTETINTLNKKLDDLLKINKSVQSPEEYGIQYILHRESLRGKPSVNAWEDREPGSLKGVLDAYAYCVPLVNKRCRIDVEEIKKIHAICMAPVGKHTAPGNFRDTKTGFKINRETSSEAGLKVLAEQHQISNNLGHSEFRKLIGNEEEILEQLKEIVELCTGGFYFGGYEEGLVGKKRSTELQHNIEIKVGEILKVLYDKLEGSRLNDASTLKVIVESVQKLERLHPFKDGNCRTFCMVILNVLLMQYEFTPTLMDDPNKFDGYTVDELVDLVKEGMERTKELCTHVTTQDKLKQPISDITLNENISDNWMEIDSAQEAMLTNFANELTNNLLKLDPVLDKSVQAQKSIKGEIQILKENDSQTNSMTSSKKNT